MLDVFGALAFKAVSAAFNLGVFEALSGGPLTAAETARQIKASEGGTTLLIEALETIGYVKKQDGRYANTAMTVKWVLRSSPTSIAGLFAHADDVLEVLPKVVTKLRAMSPMLKSNV